MTNKLKEIREQVKKELEYIPRGNLPQNELIMRTEKFIGGVCLFVGIFGLYKWLIPEVWKSGYWIVPPFISIPVNIAIVVLGLYLLFRK